MAKVLVIDDEDSVRNYLGVLIKRLGCEVCLAADAAEAMTALGNETFQMVIADIMLPDAPSMAEWTSKLTEAAGTTPIVLISGMHTAELDALVASGKVKAFLSKPFELAFVRDLLKEIQ